MNKFELGEIVVTNDVDNKMTSDVIFEKFVWRSIERFKKGDWGDLSPEDKAESDRAVTDGEMIMGSYKLDETEIWIVTEWDRSTTTILFPYEW